MKLKMVLVKHANEIYETDVQVGLMIRLRIYTVRNKTENRLCLVTSLNFFNCLLSQDSLEPTWPSRSSRRFCAMFFWFVSWVRVVFKVSNSA